jgi:hypothetical protein
MGLISTSLTLLTAFTVLMPALFLTRCEGEDGKPDRRHSQGPQFVPAAGSPFPAGKRPFGIAAGDFNGDGNLDFVTANAGSDDVTVSLGDGRAGFRPSSGSPFKAGNTPEFIAVGDLNKDGRLDLVVATHDGGYDVTLLFGEGTGRFRSAPSARFSPLKATDPHNHGLALDDVDGDGCLDIVTANAGSNKGKADNSVSVLLGNGRGNFRPATGSPFKIGGLPAALGLGDLNKDGKPDIVAAHEGGKDMTVMLSDGNGGFIVAAGSPYSLPAYGYSVGIGNLDADANADIAITHNDGRMTLLSGDGRGRFRAAPGSPLDIGPHAGNIIIIDIDGDSKNDLVLRSEENGVVVLLGNGKGNFTSAKGSPFTVGKNPLGIAIGDVNKDGKLDIITANEGSNDVTVLLAR